VTQGRRPAAGFIAGGAMKRIGLGALALGALFFASAPAFADVASTQHTKDGDNYIFKDDLLNSDVSFPRGADIRVRPPTVKTMLIRPRVSFVAEMLKSVEKM
jgi:hypothetical protein